VYLLGVVKKKRCKLTRHYEAYRNSLAANQQHRFDRCGLSGVIYQSILTAYQNNRTSMHITTRLLMIGFLFILAACEDQQQSTSPRYELATDVQHTMELIVDPAADIIWDSAGSIITAAGEQDLAPATPEGWAEGEVAAAVLAESGNLLMMPGKSFRPFKSNFAAADPIGPVLQILAAACDSYHRIAAFHRWQ
jgi:hypothetical protein